MNIVLYKQSKFSKLVNGILGILRVTSFALLFAQAAFLSLAYIVIAEATNPASTLTEMIAKDTKSFVHTVRGKIATAIMPQDTLNYYAFTEKKLLSLNAENKELRDKLYKAEVAHTEKARALSAELDATVDHKVKRASAAISGSVVNLGSNAKDLYESTTQYYSELFSQYMK